MQKPAPTWVGSVERLVSRLLGCGVAIYGRNAALFGAALLSLYILATALVALTRPDANWDMLPYLAAAEEGTYADPQQLHAYAYDTLKASISPEEYRQLTDDGGGFRSHMAVNAADFVSLLPMYRVKYFYAELLSAMSNVMSPVTAMQLISAVSALLFGAAVLFWLKTVNALALAPLVAGLLILTEFGNTARAVTPDLLCSALMVGGLAAFVARREVLTAVLVFLAFLVRPDSIIPLTVIVAFLLFYRVRSVGMLAGFVASLIGYFVISRLAQHPGWWPHLYFSSIAQQLNMDGFNPAFSVVLYAKAFVRAAVFALWYNSWVGATLFGIGLWFCLDRAGYGLDRRTGVLFAALLLGLAAKFVAFPIHDTRVYYPTLIPVFLLLAPAAMNLWTSARTARGPTED